MDRQAPFCFFPSRGFAGISESQIAQNDLGFVFGQALVTSGSTSGLRLLYLLEQEAWFAYAIVAKQALTPLTAFVFEVKQVT